MTLTTNSPVVPPTLLNLPAPPQKNIVVCLDGTGNLFESCNSNVVKLFQMCVRDRRQVAYYDPGVGTLGDSGYKTSLGRTLNKALGGAIGVGLMKNVEEAYIYLMEHYEEGDRIFIFGFSRGAFTARVLAGFVNSCGLFEKGCQNMIPYAMTSFIAQLKSGASEDQIQEFYKTQSSFRRTFGRRLGAAGGRPVLQVPIHFLGLWDTVKSYGWLYNPIRIPRESTNESVRTVRHAIAMDEKRVFFPQMHWQRKGKAQNLREVWFAGVHGDVGGTPREIESGLSKIALDWMLRHALRSGLVIDPDNYAYIVPAKPAAVSVDAPKIARPDPTARRHESLTGPWWLIEALPWRSNTDGRLCWWRPRLPKERQRVLPGSAVIHGSAITRMGLAEESYAGRSRPAPYRPGQLPALSGDQYAELMKGKPLLVDAKYPMPARLLLPLPDGSGDVLMHELSEIERQAWAETRCATGLQALCLLVQTTAKALREVHSASHLRGIVSDAIKQASEAPRFAAGSPGGRWLAAFTAPAAAAAAGNWDALAEDELAKREQALKLACGRLKDGLDEALAVVQAWHSAPAVEALVRSFEAVVGLVDSRKNFADAAQLLQHADAGPTRFQLYQAIDHLDRFVRRWRLTPEQRKALLDVRGNAHESLVTWADRLDSAGATALAT